MPVTDALAATAATLGDWIASVQALAVRVGEQALEPVRRISAPTPVAATDATADDEAQAQEEIAAAKFEVDGGPPATSAATAADGETGLLPAAYGADCLVLLPRDPGCLFAYWEVTPATRRATLDTLPEPALAGDVLRVLPARAASLAGDAATLARDVEVPTGEQRAYLTVPPGAACRVQLGVRTPGGRFVPLVEAGPVAMPRPVPSADTSVRWLDMAATGTPPAS